MACKELQLCNIKYSAVSLMPKGGVWQVSLFLFSSVIILSFVVNPCLRYYYITTPPSVPNGLNVYSTMRFIAVSAFIFIFQSLSTTVHHLHKKNKNKNSRCCHCFRPNKSQIFKGRTHNNYVHRFSCIVSAS